MTTDHADLKRRHELAVAQVATRLIRNEEGFWREVRSGDPKVHEPDAVFDTIDGSIGIEVACGYYGDPATPEGRAEREAIWAIPRGRPERDHRIIREGDTIEETLARSPGLTNMSGDLVASLQRTMERHCGRTYAIPTTLVLDATMSHAPLTSAEDVDRVLPRLRVPDGCTFGAVYLLMSRNWTGERVIFPVRG